MSYRFDTLAIHAGQANDEATGAVETGFTPASEHIGFEGIIHGGILATVLDEAMVWAATWRIRRFCLCGELMVRFRQGAAPGQQLKIEALVETSRPRLVETAGKVFDASGKLLVTASGKYVPLTPEQHQAVIASFTWLSAGRSRVRPIRRPGRWPCALSTGATTRRPPKARPCRRRKRMAASWPALLPRGTENRTCGIPG